MVLLITGGAGFIGSNFCQLVRKNSPETKLVILDALTYAGNLQNLDGVLGNPGVTFVHGSIANPELIERLFNEYHPDVIVNFAAETHVDRSVHGEATNFVETNINGVHVLLEAVKTHGGRLIQISTDEVYGTLDLESRERFSENSPIKPNSPYSSSKASAGLLCRAYFESFGTDVIVTRCANNYGPREFPEKVIPYWITLLMQGRKIPLYGDGRNVRDWIHVNDHCRAIWGLIEKGQSGEAYNIGVGNEWSNADLAKLIIREMDMSEDMIRHVADRPGHDRRYAVDASKLFKTIDFTPAYPRNKFVDGFKETIEWYKQNEPWIEALRERFGEFNPHIAPEPQAKVLVLGTGFLGQQYVDHFNNNGYEAVGVDRDVIDITVPESIERAIKEHEPEIVVNAVAMTDIDWCEKNRAQSVNVNTIGADNVAAICQEKGIYLVHVSSGCIQESPSAEVVHKEDDPVSPVCFYSWTKVFAEQLVQDRAKRFGLKALIPRPRQLLSAKLSPRNALTKMMTYTKFVDTANSCTIVDDLLSSTVALIEQDATGIYNITNPGVTSPYRIAQKLREIIKPDMEFSLISKQELNAMTFAQRIDSVLNTDKLNAAGITLESIDKRLEDIIRDLKQRLASEEGQKIMGVVHAETTAKLSIKQPQPQL